jgi:hypothetical protein
MSYHFFNAPFPHTGLVMGGGLLIGFVTAVQSAGLDIRASVGGALCSHRRICQLRIPFAGWRKRRLAMVCRLILRVRGGWSDCFRSRLRRG